MAEVTVASTPALLDSPEACRACQFHQPHAPIHCGQRQRPRAATSTAASSLAATAADAADAAGAVIAVPAEAVAAAAAATTTKAIQNNSHLADSGISTQQLLAPGLREPAVRHGARLADLGDSRPAEAGANLDKRGAVCCIGRPLFRHRKDSSGYCLP